SAVESKKKDTKREKEEKKREEKEKLRKEKEEKQMAETLKRSKGKDAKKKRQVEKTTSVTKIPSLSRVGKRAQIFFITFLASVYVTSPIHIYLIPCVRTLGTLID
uniref:Uncharacterized protein n=1 Tax=Parascaris equorum TaxID=6256 RepID=A0A914RPB0_PAREQ